MTLTSRLHIATLLVLSMWLLSASTITILYRVSKVPCITLSTVPMTIVARGHGQ